MKKSGLKRKILTGVLIVTGFLGLGLVLGPKVQLDRRLKPVQLPEDLDAYLARSEANVPLTTPDVAKKIVWADPQSKTKTDISFIYLHGYGATLMEIDPVTRLVSQHFNANVFYTRLAGHGQSREQFAKATANQWMQDTLEAWEIGKAIGDKVVIIGTSTGATLGTWLAATRPVDELASLVFVSPNFYPADPAAPLLLWPWGTTIAKLIEGGAYHPWVPYNQIQAKYWVTEPAFETSAQLMALVHMVDLLDLSAINAPALFIYSERDDVVSVPKIKQKFHAIGSSPKKLLEMTHEKNPSQHVIAGDIVGMHNTEAATQAMIAFLEKTLNGY